MILCPLTVGAQEVMEKRDTLDASRVTADKRERDDASTQTGLQRIDASRINRGFALFNSPDIIKTLQTLPGVAAGTELMSGIYVHGGDGSDNLFMLDGVPIYQVSHLIGLFSSFNSDVVESLDFYKSGFPARYGGRASSVVDVSTKSGDFEEYHGLASIGLIDGRIHVEGPIQKGKTSFNFGVRRTWLDVVTTPALWYVNHRTKKESDDGMADKYSGGYNFGDWNLGITHKFAEDNILKFNFYTGEDKARVKMKEPQKHRVDGVNHIGYDENSLKVNWGNTLASLNWQYEFSDQLRFDAVAYHSRNRSFIGLSSKAWSWYGKDMYDTHNEDIKSYVNVSGLKADFHILPNAKNHIRTGAVLQLKRYLPSRSYHSKSEWDSESEALKGGTSNFYTGFEAAAYAEDEISIAPWMKANLGARTVLMAVRGKAWLKLEPRASFKIQCAPNTSIRMSYSEMNQFDHSVSSVYIDLPTNTWMPSTALIKPMFSRQIAGGVYTNIRKDTRLSVEGWYKTMNHMYEYGGQSSLYPPIDTWETEFIEGKGKSWGVETGLEYERAKFAAQIYYTLSWSIRKYDDFYFDWYPDRNDNRHKFDVMLNYRPRPKFELYAGWHYHTGNNVTAATYSIKTDADLTITDIYDRPNSIKLPDYHRLDLGLNWHRTKKSGHEAVWNLSIYNAYCRMNAVIAQIEDEYVDQIGPDGYMIAVPTGRVVGTATGLIPIIPTVGYTYKF